MNRVHGAVGRYFRGRATLGVRGAGAGSGLRALAVPNFAARAAAADVLVYRASGEIPPRSRIRELGFRSARVAPPGCRPLSSCNGHALTFHSQPFLYRATDVKVKRGTRKQEVIFSFASQRKCFRSWVVYFRLYSSED